MTLRSVAEKIVEKHYAGCPKVHWDGNVRTLCDEIEAALREVEEEAVSKSMPLQLADLQEFYKAQIKGMHDQAYDKGWNSGVEEAAKVAKQCDCMCGITKRIRALKREDKNV